MMARAVAPQVGATPRVNLLPRSELERRERERLTGTWARVVLGALVLTALLIGAAYAWNQFAQQQLAAEQARTTTLTGQIAGLSDVSRSLQTERDLIAYRAEAMGSDLAWSGIFAKARGALPADVTLVGFDLTVGAVPDAASQQADAEKAKAAAKEAVGLTGTITVSSPTPRDMAPYARALRQVEGISGADANAIATDSGSGYLYTIDITFDQTVYSNSFAPAGKAAK
jgi:hypothetical protein